MKYVVQISQLHFRDSFDDKRSFDIFYFLKRRPLKKRHTFIRTSGRSPEYGPFICCPADRKCVKCGTWNFVRRLFCCKCGAPRIPGAPLFPGEDWFMESDESPAHHPNQESHPQKISSNPPFNEAANHQQLFRRFHFTTIFYLESSRCLGGVQTGFGMENYGGEVKPNLTETFRERSIKSISIPGIIWEMIEKKV